MRPIWCSGWTISSEVRFLGHRHRFCRAIQAPAPQRIKPKTENLETHFEKLTPQHAPYLVLGLDDSNLGVVLCQGQQLSVNFHMLG